MSYEAIRAWTVKLDPKTAANLSRRKLPPSPRWHLDEMVCESGGEHVFLWRAVHDEGEVRDPVVRKRRDTYAALKLLKQLLRSPPVEPESIVTDGLASYGCLVAKGPRELRLQAARLHAPRVHQTCAAKARQSRMTLPCRLSDGILRFQGEFSCLSCSDRPRNPAILEINKHWTDVTAPIILHTKAQTS